jgi:hypothetical protein
MKPSAVATAGVALLLVSFAGMAHAFRASFAQALYYESRYGWARENTDGILRRCETAGRLYPFNYDFPICSAEKAYYSRNNGTVAETRERLDAARLWCDAGLELNPYRSELRLLKTRLIAMSSPARAAQYWKDYVGWHFWDPYNHAVLAGLYAEAGEVEKAVDSLQWVKGSKYYEEAAGNIKKAWEKEMIEPDFAGSGSGSIRQ